MSEVTMKNGNAVKCLAALLNCLLCFALILLAIGCDKKKGDENSGRPLTSVELAERDVVNWACWVEYKYPSAEEAQKSFFQLKKRLGGRFDEMSDIDQGNAYQVLAKCFFFEEKYPEAFQYSLEAEQEYPFPYYDVFLPYMAGIAGEKEWLKADMRKYKKTDPEYSRYVEINLAWADKDFKKVDSLASVFLSDYDKENPAQLGRAIWVGVIRAKALLELKLPEKAEYELAIKERSYDFNSLQRASIFSVHAFSAMGYLMEKSGMHKNALMWFSAAKKQIPLLGGAPDRVKGKIDAKMQSLSMKLGWPLPEVEKKESWKINQENEKSTKNNWLNNLMLRGLLELP